MAQGCFVSGQERVSLVPRPPSDLVSKAARPFHHFTIVPSESERLAQRGRPGFGVECVVV
jgi:hypothetical protein